MNKNKEKKKKYKKPTVTTEKLESPEQIVVHAAYCNADCGGTPTLWSAGPC